MAKNKGDRFRDAALLAGIGLAPLTAAADSGSYLKAAAGMNFLDAQQWTVREDQAGPLPLPVGPGESSATVDFREQGAGSLSFGYAWGAGLRTDLELAVRRNEIKDIRSASGAQRGGADGVQRAEAAFANLWWDVFSQSALHPYLGGGAGMAKVGVSRVEGDNSGLQGDEDSVFAYQLGAGLAWRVNPRITLSLDYRHVRANDLRLDLGVGASSSRIDYKAESAMIGVRIALSAPAEEMPSETSFDADSEPVTVVDPVEPSSEITDAGTADPDLDASLTDAEEPPTEQTGGDASGNAASAAESEAVAAEHAGAEAGSETPASESAVPGSADAASASQASGTGACAPPLPGEQISLEGCRAGDSIVLRGVTFNDNTAVLTPDSRLILDQVTDELMATPGVAVEIQGHTDSDGDDAYNLQLSEARARAVSEYLVSRGVDPSRLSAQGLGETQPVADNDSEANKALNRRVELRLSQPATEAASAE